MIFMKFVTSIFTLKSPGLHLNVSTEKGPNLHLDLPRLVWTTGACDAHGNSVKQWPELHWSPSVQQEPLLLPDVATLQHAPVLLLDVLHHRGLSCTWTCLRYITEDYAAP